MKKSRFGTTWRAGILLLAFGCGGGGGGTDSSVAGIDGASSRGTGGNAGGNAFDGGLIGTGGGPTANSSGGTYDAGAGGAGASLGSGGMLDGGAGAIDASASIGSGGSGGSTVDGGLGLVDGGAVAGAGGGVVDAAADGSGGSVAPVQPLPVSTLVFEKRTASGPGEHDELWAYDAISQQAKLITNLTDGSGSETQIWGHSISPDRKSIAFSAYFRPSSEDLATKLATAAIWTVSADGQSFQRVSPVQPDTGTTATACTVDAQCTAYSSDYYCSSKGFCSLRLFEIAVQDPAWSPDGKTIMYGIGNYWMSASGQYHGGILPFTSPATGGTATQVLASPLCSQVSDVAYDPNGGGFLAINSVCSSSTNEGLWYYPMAGGSSPVQIAGSSLNNVNVTLDPPTWASDGSGFVFTGTTATTIDGASVNAAVGLIYFTNTSALDVLVNPVSKDYYIDSVTVSTDGQFVAYAMRNTSTEATDIYVVDYRGASPASWQATSDGNSKEPRF